ncbi:MAG: porin family protein [Gammaproteobacteria bacterium]|nr:porin family protein [Gammaproteobacteria bacterium]
MQHKQLIAGVGLLILTATPVMAEDNWFVRPYIGLSEMSDLDADFSNIDSLSGKADIDLDTGFTGGIGIGYNYSDNFGVEVGWEYRSNDSEVVLAGSSEFDDGNYASNIFYLNGHYRFAPNGDWRPYVGGGLTWVEEIDIDLERSGEELSYSGDGDVGYQLFAGVDYRINPDWSLQGELRYGSITGIDLDGESGDPGEMEDLDYETTTLQVGLVYQF